MEYNNNRKSEGVDETIPAVVVDLPLYKIPGVDIETFEEEFVEDANLKSAKVSNATNAPTCRGRQNRAKIVKNTTPHIDTE